MTIPTLVAYGHDNTPYVSVFNINPPFWTPETISNAPDGSVRGLAFSWDGKLLAVGTTSGQISIYDTSDWSLVHRFSSGLGSCEGLDFHPDNSKLIYTGTSTSPYVKTIDTATWSVTGTFEGTETIGGIWAICINAVRGEVLFSLPTTAGFIRNSLFDNSSLPTPDLPVTSGGAPAISANQDYIVLGEPNPPYAHCFRYSDLARVSIPTGISSDRSGVAISADGQRVLMTGETPRAAWHSMPDLAYLKNAFIPSPGGTIRDCRTSSDGLFYSLALAGGVDGVVCVASADLPISGWDTLPGNGKITAFNNRGWPRPAALAMSAN